MCAIFPRYWLISVHWQKLCVHKQKICVHKQKICFRRFVCTNRRFVCTSFPLWSSSSSSSSWRFHTNLLLVYTSCKDECVWKGKGGKVGTPFVLCNDRIKDFDVRVCVVLLTFDVHEQALAKNNKKKKTAWGCSVQMQTDWGLASGKMRVDSKYMRVMSLGSCDVAEAWSGNDDGQIRFWCGGLFCVEVEK